MVRLESVLEKLAAQSAQQAAQSAQQAAQSAQQAAQSAQQQAALSERMARLESSLGTFGALIAFLVTAVPVALMFLQKK